jgi:DNA-binding SARP family transcriptional activator
VLAGDRVVPIGGGRRLSLLALLLINANEVVSAERLIDQLWGESPPATATKSLQVRVSELRRALGGAAAPLLTRGNGYLLRMADDELDSRRFEVGLGDGQRRLGTGDARGAAVRLDEALALWRGPALSGLDYEPFAQQEIARLERKARAVTVRWSDAAFSLRPRRRRGRGARARRRWRRGRTPP